MGYGVAEASLKSEASEVIVVSSTLERVELAVKRLEDASLWSGKVRGEVVNEKDHEALKKFILGIGEMDHIVWTSGDTLHRTFPNIDPEEAKGTIVILVLLPSFHATHLHYILASFDVRFWGPVIVAQNAKFRPRGSLTLTNGMCD